MTRCNIRNGTQNEIKRHCGPQRARSNPRYGNLKGKNANSPPTDSSRIPLLRAASSPPGFLRGKEGSGRASPWCRVAVPSSLPATGPAEPPWPWPHVRDPVGTSPPARGPTDPCSPRAHAPRVSSLRRSCPWHAAGSCRLWQPASALQRPPGVRGRSAAECPPHAHIQANTVTGEAEQQASCQGHAATPARLLGALHWLTQTAGTGQSRQR